MNSPESPKISPLTAFDRKVSAMTDFNDYLRLLVKEGLPILCEGEFVSVEHRNQRIRILTARMTGTVLENREKNGLSNGAYDLMKEFREKEKLPELIEDIELRTELAKGIILGFEAKGLIPRDWNFQLKAFFN